MDVPIIIIFEIQPLFGLILRLYACIAVIASQKSTLGISNIFLFNFQDSKFFFYQ